MKKLIVTIAFMCLCIIVNAQPFASGYATPEQGMMYSVVGNKFKDVTLNGLDKKPHKLSEYVGKGNYVLIDFWASWCGPCMREMPVVKECYEKYKKKGFNVVGCSLDSRDAEWRRTIKDNNMSWTHLSDLKGFESAASTAYFLEYIPWTLLCDGKGKIIEANLRDDALRSRLQEIYGF